MNVTVICPKCKKERVYRAAKARERKTEYCSEHRNLAVAERRWNHVWLWITKFGRIYGPYKNRLEARKNKPDNTLQLIMWDFDYSSKDDTIEVEMRTQIEYFLTKYYSSPDHQRREQL